MPLWTNDPRIPQLGRNVPRAHGRLAERIGRLGLGLTGWRIEGTLPDEAKFVLIVAPHTSNWDFLLGAYTQLALRLGARFVGKHTLFRWPLASIMRWLGGIPVNRNAPGGFVGEAAAAVRAAERMVLVLAPEGTRRRAPWKSGFYRIALAASVPIVPCGFDYRRKVVFFRPPFTPTGDYEGDLALLRAHYSREMALVPENYEG